MLASTLPHQLPMHLPRLWRFALKLTRNNIEAEDLVQRTCLRALEKEAQWQLGSNLLGWLFTIMHNIWMNELRQRRSLPEELLDDNSINTCDHLHDESPEQVLGYKQMLRIVDELPEGQRLVLNLIAVEGMSYQETAEVLDVPIGTVMSRLARARLGMKEKMLSRGVSYASFN